MTGGQVIAAVTATLKRSIFRALSDDPDLSGALVTSKPPDRARTEAGAGNQINLFLYRMSIDTAWRNQDPPRLRPGERAEPALPLVLSYLLTAYGEDDDEVTSQSLLEVGVRVMHNQPLLSRKNIAAALPGSALESQIERVRITLNQVSVDEISKLWTTFQTGYRNSVNYDVSVVLIDSNFPVRAPLPVLARGTADTDPVVIAGSAPIITAASAPGGRVSLQPGEQLVLRGHHLSGVSTVRISSQQLTDERALHPDSTSEQEVRATLPADDPVPAGQAVVTVATPAEGGLELVSKGVLIGLAPMLTDGQLAATLERGQAVLTVHCRPPVQPDQDVGLVVGDRIVAPELVDQPADARTELAFRLEDFEPGTYVLRLRVDGQDSIANAAEGHVFDDQQTVVLA